MAEIEETASELFIRPNEPKLVIASRTCQLVICERLEMGGFHKWGYPQMDGFIREYPIKTDDVGVPLF